MKRRELLTRGAQSAAALLFAPAAAKLLTALDRPGQDNRFPPADLPRFREARHLPQLLHSW